MPQRALQEKHIKLLDALIPEILNGAISTEWVVIKDRDTIDHIKGFPSNLAVWMNIWSGQINQSDLNIFVHRGFLLQQEDRVYTVDTQAIIDELEKIKQNSSLSTNISHPNHDADNISLDWDVFISHASEDKDEIARPLTEKLMAKGIKVWFDEITLELGDSLRRSIDNGLSKSRYGILILSPNFFAKEWPRRELDGFVALEKRLLPVWHKVDKGQVTEFSPMLADKYATSTSKGLDNVVNDIIKVVQKNLSSNIKIGQDQSDPLKGKVAEIISVLRKTIEGQEYWTCGEINLVSKDDYLIAATSADEFSHIELLKSLGWNEPSRSSEIIPIPYEPKFTQMWQTKDIKSKLNDIANELILINTQVHNLSINKIKSRKFFF